MPAHKKATRGVCRQCGCTNERGCAPGCSWVEPRLCSACYAENEVVKAIRERPRFEVSLTQFFAEVMPEGSWDELGDMEFAELFVGEASRVDAAVAR